MKNLEDEERLLEDSSFTTDQPPIRDGPGILRKTLIGLGLLFLFILGIFIGRGTTTAGDRSTESKGTTGTVPIGSIQATFNEDERFMQVPPQGDYSEPIWDTLLPNGLGYVRLSDPDSSIATVAAMHQLHCLYTLRRIFFAEASGDNSTRAFDNGVPRELHVTHCFDYLRQAIMCNADSTLEPFHVKDTNFPGIGFARTCRNYEELKDWADKSHALDAKGFIQPKLSHGRVNESGQG